MFDFISVFVDLNETQDMEEFRSFSTWWDGLISHGLRAFTWEVNHHPTLLDFRDPTVLGKAVKPFAVEYSFINVKRNPLLLSIQ